MVLRCVRFFVGVFALSLGLSAFGGAVDVQAATLLVDDFGSVGTPPAPSSNVWNEGALSGVLGGAREQTKAGSGTNASRFWSNTPAGTLSLTTSQSSNTWTLVYDGAANGNLTNSFNPLVDLYGFDTLDLDVTQTSATPGSVQLTLVTVNGDNTALNWTATQTVNMTTGSGIVSFDLWNLSGDYNPVDTKRIQLKFQGFGSGTLTLNNLAFNGGSSAVPEPTSFALASCGLLALIALRRRRR